MTTLVERLNELREKATPGPWERCVNYIRTDPDMFMVVAASQDGTWLNEEENLELICELVNNLDTIISALVSSEEGMGWQPIETAPKDGTPIILAVAGNEFFPRSGWWSADFERWVVRISFDGESATGLGINPTHWMPLPKSPTSIKEV